MRVVYLHGFASSPQSSKAQYFAAKLRAAGVEVGIPRLDEGDFEGLTITGQLGVVDRAVAGRPAVLMGSSLGGYLAALYAARHAGVVERLVLMAPAFQFPRRWRERYAPEELERWRVDGSVPIFHYGYGEERRLGYRFLEDSRGYEEEPDFAQPALILHGVDDPVVPAGYSRAFAASHPNATLHLMKSGHELTDVVDPMWELVREFLALPGQ